jgi:hypothetical protein
MADDVGRDPDAVGRCPPYSWQSVGSSAVEPRFLTSPHLILFVPSEEHVRAILQGERIVTYSPQHSTLSAWLNSGDPEDYRGALII